MTDISATNGCNVHLHGSLPYGSKVAVSPSSCSVVLNCSSTDAQDTLSVVVLLSDHYIGQRAKATRQIDDYCCTDVVVLDADALHSMLLLQLIGLAKSCYCRC